MIIAATLGGILIGWAARWVYEVARDCRRM